MKCMRSKHTYKWSATAHKTVFIRLAIVRSPLTLFTDNRFSATQRDSGSSLSFSVCVSVYFISCTGKYLSYSEFSFFLHSFFFYVPNVWASECFFFAISLYYTSSSSLYKYIQAIIIRFHFREFQHSMYVAQKYFIE